VDIDIEVCFSINHDTRQFPRKNAPPLVLFLSSILPAQSTYVYAIRVKSLFLEYHKPKYNVPFIYLNILFTSCNVCPLVHVGLQKCHTNITHYHTFFTYASITSLIIHYHVTSFSLLFTINGSHLYFPNIIYFKHF
jgi:hypothetical protein